jgi:hypothetical protein
MIGDDTYRDEPGIGDVTAVCATGNIDSSHLRLLCAMRGRLGMHIAQRE